MASSRNRLNAFTIMELTIAMLLTAIVVAITYTAYHMISQVYIEFKHKQDEMATIIRVDELLKKDIQRSEVINRSNQMLDFQDSAGAVKYSLVTGSIIRNAIITDTFKVKMVSFETFFENNPVYNDSTANEQAKPIDEILVKIILRKDTICYHYHKNYSSQNLINASSYAIN